MSNWKTDDYNGGKYRTIQTADTTPTGWGVAIVERIEYTGRHIYQVVRYSPQNRFTPLYWAEDEASMRRMANKVWSEDRAA